MTSAILGGNSTNVIPSSEMFEIGSGGEANELNEEWSCLLCVCRRRTSFESTVPSTLSAEALGKLLKNAWLRLQTDSKPF